MVVSTHKPTIEFLKQLEGFIPYAKLDVNAQRIGYGCGVWDDGSLVKKGQTITKEKAEKVLIYNMMLKEQKLNAMLTNESKLTAYQKGALLSYVFNRGEENFRKSQLRIMVNKNPNDSSIPKQFEIEWGTTVSYKDSLIKRRAKEGAFYQIKEVSSNSGGSNSTASTPTFLDVSILLSFLYLGYKFLKSYAT